ncbi:MAG: hypothetical protein ACRDRW_14500 [Pseudonocardiaceae bacterium]
MSATTLTLAIEPGPLNARSSWMEFESLAVEMSREVPLRALEAALADAQKRLIDSVCGLRWAPVQGLAAPFACPRCEMAEDFARKGKRTRRRKLHTAAGTVELVLWHVGCCGCGRVFAPLLVMLGLSGTRRTDRLTVDLAELAPRSVSPGPRGCLVSWPGPPPRRVRRITRWPIPRGTVRDLCSEVYAGVTGRLEPVTCPRWVVFRSDYGGASVGEWSVGCGGAG